jgi:hypothetical protein
VTGVSSSETRFCLEFSAPAGLDIQEIRDDEAFSDEPLRSPLLEVLRAALQADHRWTLVRVSALLPDMNGEPPLLVWVTSELPRGDVQAGVYDLVSDVIHGAMLRRMTNET